MTANRVAGLLTVDDAAVWRLAGREVINGALLEVRLHCPAVWLPIWVEGLPDGPLGCFLASLHQTMQIPLYPGKTVLRWPRTLDGRLQTTAQARTQANQLQRVRHGFFAQFEDVERRLGEVLDLVEEHGGKYHRSFCREALACVYPTEIAALDHQQDEGGPDGSRPDES